MWVSRSTRCFPRAGCFCRRLGKVQTPWLPVPTLPVPGHSQAARETFACLLLLQGRHFLFADREQRRERGRQDILPPARGMNMLINSSPWQMDSSYQLTQTRRGRGLAKGGGKAFPLASAGDLGSWQLSIVISEGQEMLGERLQPAVYS